MRLLDDLTSQFFDFCSDEGLTIEDCYNSLPNYANKFMVEYKLNENERIRFKKWIINYFEPSITEQILDEKQQVADVMLEQIKRDFE